MAFVLRCYSKWNSSVIWGCMFQHCWRVYFVFTGIIKPRSPEPSAFALSGFCRWDVSIRWAAQWHGRPAGHKSTWIIQLPGISWSEMTSPQVSTCSCELPTEITKQGLFSWIIPLGITKDQPLYAAIPVRLVLEVWSNHVFISCEIELRNPTKQETSNPKEPQRLFHLVDSGDLKKLKMSACWVEQGWTHQFVANLLSCRAAEDLSLSQSFYPKLSSSWHQFLVSLTFRLR